MVTAAARSAESPTGMPSAMAVHVIECVLLPALSLLSSALHQAAAVAERAAGSAAVVLGGKGTPATGADGLVLSLAAGAGGPEGICDPAGLGLGAALSVSSAGAAALGLALPLAPAGREGEGRRAGCLFREGGSFGVKQVAGCREQCS